MDNYSVIIQQAYPDGGFEPMIELTRERNESYCKRHGFDYEVHIDPVNPDWKMEQGGWAKLLLIRDALQKGYEYVIWLDADAMIYDLDIDLRAACTGGIGVCWHRIPQLNHWNVGVMYLRNSEEVRDFIAEWLDQYPGANDGWFEQGAFNRLGMKSKVVHTLSDKWNATVNVSMVPDAVVLGFHGHGNAKQRFEAMKRISDKEAVKAQEKSEVHDG